MTLCVMYLQVMQKVKALIPSIEINEFYQCKCYHQTYYRIAGKFAVWWINQPTTKLKSTDIKSLIENVMPSCATFRD